MWKSDSARPRLLFKEHWPFYHCKATTRETQATTASRGKIFFLLFFTTVSPSPSLHVKSVNRKTMDVFRNKFALDLLSGRAFLDDVHLQSLQRCTSASLTCSKVFVCSKMCWIVSRRNVAKVQPQRWRPKASYCFPRARNNKRTWLTVLFFELVELPVPLEESWIQQAVNYLGPRLLDYWRLQKHIDVSK